MQTFSLKAPRFHADIETIRIDMETRHDYDVTFMMDRLVVTAYANGRKGFSSVGLPCGALEEHLSSTEKLVHEMLPDMRRRAIDGALGLGYEKELSRLGEIIRNQSGEIRHLSRPWYIKARDGLVTLWGKVKAVYA